MKYIILGAGVLAVTLIILVGYEASQIADASLWDACMGNC